MCRFRWFIVIGVAATLLVDTAQARPISIKGAAATAWKKHRSSGGGATTFTFRGRNGAMQTRICPGSRATPGQVVVKSQTPSGRRRTTVFGVGQQHGPLRRLSSVLQGAPASRRRAPRRIQRSGDQGRYNNPRLEAARGHAPGTVGHAAAVGRAGFHPDSIGLERQSGARRGSMAYSRYWSAPRTTPRAW